MTGVSWCGTGKGSAHGEYVHASEEGATGLGPTARESRAWSRRALCALYADPPRSSRTTRDGLGAREGVRDVDGEGEGVRDADAVRD